MRVGLLFRYISAEHTLGQTAAAATEGVSKPLARRPQDTHQYCTSLAFPLL